MLNHKTVYALSNKNSEKYTLESFISQKSPVLSFIHANFHANAISGIFYYISRNNEGKLATSLPYHLLKLNKQLLNLENIYITSVRRIFLHKTCKLRLIDIVLQIFSFKIFDKSVRWDMFASSLWKVPAFIQLLWFKFFFLNEC